MVPLTQVVAKKQRKRADCFQTLLLLSTKGPGLPSLINNAMLFWRTWTSLICEPNTFMKWCPGSGSHFISFLRHSSSLPSYRVTRLHLPSKFVGGFWPGDLNLQWIIYGRSLFVGADGRSSSPDSPCACWIWSTCVRRYMLSSSLIVLSRSRWTL